MFAKRNACEKLHYWPTPPFNPTLYPTKVMPSTLAHDRVQSLMKKVPAWEHKKDIIERVFEFDDYMSGMDFVNAVAEIAEGANHHPEVIIGYAKVTVWLTTHDKGGLTESDFEIAARIDNLVD
jgi:4a-hydroxytetrahydrobiopterin dehydratase|tara:strand:+ start:84 stop:452 length:369 start_codon:yes stop_codon:yes gene_type:complete